jgi:hypothetical protein
MDVLCVSYNYVVVVFLARGFEGAFFGAFSTTSVIASTGFVTAFVVFFGVEDTPFDPSSSRTVLMTL